MSRDGVHQGPVGVDHDVECRVCARPRTVI